MTTPADLMERAADTARRKRGERERQRFLGDAARLSVAIEADMLDNGPLRFVLASAHQRAIQAFLDLAVVDAADADAIRRLQNEVVRYGDMLEWLTLALSDGETARQELDSAADEAMVDAFTVRMGEQG